MSGTNQHIVQRSNGWAVRGGGNSKDTSHHNTQRDAIDAARNIATNQGADVIIHGRDGRIRARDTYGKPDPFPPRG